jgi:hypothetical protein
MPSISRRSFLAGASSLPLATSNSSSPGAGPAQPDGRICLGLNGLTFYAGLYSLLNAWTQGAPVQVIANGVDYYSNIPPGLPKSPWDGYLDPNGELVNPLPNGVTHLNRVFYAGSASHVDRVDRVGQRWVLKWDGTARNVSVAGASVSARAGNRIEWTWASNANNMWVSFSGMLRNDPPRNIRLCELRHEARLDAGEVFNPDWVAKVREGSGIIRFMDWQCTNNNRSTLRFSDIPTAEHCSYGGDTGKPHIKGGMPLALMSTLAKQVQSHPWVCIPNVLGTRKMSGLKTISNANPAVVTAPGHNWEDGDKVIPYATNWPQIERGTFTVSHADRKAGTFALSGVDSSGFGPYTSNWASLTSPLDLKSVARELAPLAAHFRDNVAPPLVTYFELGNELWNSMFNAPHWLAAQARGRFPGDDNLRMAGYLAAHCMRVGRDTYGLDSRRRWRGVLATQTVSPYVTNRLLEGVKLYISEHAPGLTVPDLFDDLAVTGYWGGGFKKENKAKVLEWMDESEKRFKDGREPTKYSYFNRIVNEDCTDGRHTEAPYCLSKIPAFWAAQKKVADANGLGLIQYEGGNHNDPRFFDALTTEERERFMEFYRRCNHTPEDAANYTAMFNSFVAMGGKYPSKFVEAGPVSRYGAWGGLRYLGDSNSVWDAVVAFNQRS